MSEDTPESIKNLARDLIQPGWNLGTNIACEALFRYAELLERSAGVWVSVGERLPTKYVSMPTLVNGKQFNNSDWRDSKGNWRHKNTTHWLDVKLPGE